MASVGRDPKGPLVPTSLPNTYNAVQRPHIGMLTIVFPCLPLSGIAPSVSIVLISHSQLFTKVKSSWYGIGLLVNFISSSARSLEKSSAQIKFISSLNHHSL